MIISSANEGLSRRTRKAHNQLSELIKSSNASQPQRTRAAPPESPPTSRTRNKKRGKQKATAAELEFLDAPTTSAISPPAPRKRRKTVATSVPDDITDTLSPPQPTLDPSECISAQSHDRTARSSRRRPGASKAVLPATVNLPPKTRKVILRVTPPEDALGQLLRKSSEPIQSPSIKLDKKTNASIAKVQARAKAAAVLAEKRAELCRNGWYLPLDRNGERRREPPEEPERRGDIWDVILKAVEAAYRPEPLYAAVTRRICEAVKARAEPSLCEQVAQGRVGRGIGKGKGLKKQRDDPETTRRKKLAKATVELVTDQWKRVVLVRVICFF